MPQHIQDHEDAGNLLRRKELFFPDGLATEFLLSSIDQASVPDYLPGVADLRDNSCNFEQCAKYLNHLATTLLDNTSTVRCKFCGKLGHATRSCKFDPTDIPRITMFCQHCESTEHLTEDCPEDNHCPSCREYGHIKYHCPDHLKSFKRKAMADFPETERHPKAGRSMESQCNSCGRVGHTSENCPACFICHALLDHQKNCCPAQCSNCGNTGHQLDFCLMIPKCTLCQGTGHWMAECQNVQSNHD
jgi:hypothetical protein